ncbi:phage tail assembly chaperone [Paraburkholderia sediminicola]|uniref:XkdW family protein n=1 Tax=Paraburkholderia sediminicola TaxID=458836 RepID=UPI0038BBFEC1
MEQTYSHDMLITVIQTLYPTLEHGRDFLVGHPIDAGTGAQAGDPFIAVWKSTAVPRLDETALKAEFIANEATYRSTLARAYRDRLLSASDGKANAPADAPVAVKAMAAAWETYRQALRELPKQPGFPFSVQWPPVPA